MKRGVFTVDYGESATVTTLQGISGQSWGGLYMENTEIDIPV